jgi:hypothetical protein
MTITELDQRAWQARARHLGIDAALTAATWLMLNEQQATSVLDDIDPAVLDDIRVPNLSGEYTDDPTSSSLAREITGDDEVDPDLETALSDAWEGGRDEVWSHAVEAHACRVLGNVTAALRVERYNELRADAARTAVGRWAHETDRWVPILSERVAQGVALLDEREPGWRGRVKWDVLRMEVPALCVVGQLFTEDAYRSGDYDHGLDVLGLSVPAATQHGFDLTYSEILESVDQHIEQTSLMTALYVTMGQLWREAASS